MRMADLLNGLAWTGRRVIDLASFAAPPSFPAGGTMAVNAISQ
jgi:hypothetical protein